MNAYETRLLYSYLANLASVVDAGSGLGAELPDWVESIAQSVASAPMVRKRRHRRLNSKSRPGDAPADPERFTSACGLLREKTAERRPKPDRTARRLGKLAKITGLNRLDLAILELLLRSQSNPLLESMLDQMFRPPGPGIEALNIGGNALPLLLGETSGRIQARLRRDAPLLRSGLVILDRDGDLRLPGRLLRLAHQPGNDSSDIARLLFDSASESALEWDDFDHIAKQGNHIETLLRGALGSDEKGVNILLYGPPGTGKTEFCKVLAKRLGVVLYSIGEANEDSSEPSRWERMQELNIAQRLLGRDRKSLLLFDEIEDLLVSDLEFMPPSARFRSRRHQQGSSRVYMHRLLEKTPVPTLWTMNHARNISPAILRRMMFALEMRPPGASVRARVWQRQLDQNQIKAGPEEVQELARDFDATPAIAAGATAAARISGGDLATVRMGVESLARLLGSNKPPEYAPKDFELDLIHADSDPEELARQISATSRRNFSLCLQGPPGTGKSAFARHLAERLGLEVMHKRASDLMSPWVGETEQAIARAFAEARDAEAFLVFDEADSLLADRRQATRNWEISQVNEMLTWMENHPLPFACTTNFVDRLDRATLRRFTFKISLDYLTTEQNNLAFETFFSLAPPPALAHLVMLTPGDFAVVRKKAGILGYLEDPAKLVAMLAQECAAKPEQRRTIGFVA